MLLLQLGFFLYLFQLLAGVNGLTSVRLLVSRFLDVGRKYGNLSKLECHSNYDDLYVTRMENHYNKDCTSIIQKSTVTRKFYKDKRDDDIQDVTLVPLSLEPIILISSQPLLTNDECERLRQFFMDRSNPRAKSHMVENRDKNESDAFALFQRVQTKIDELTGCTHHDGESEFPRYITYEPVFDSFETPLLQDGLHVDTNNGMFFRHMTILLYLTSIPNCDGGATTFPLAKKYSWTSSIQSQHESTDSKIYEDLLKSAQNLLNANIYHSQYLRRNKSREDLNNDLSRCCFKLEQAAYRSFSSSSIKELSPYGIRVIPKAGYICVVSNVLPNGLSDPHAFHAGETLFFRQNNYQLHSESENHETQSDCFGFEAKCKERKELLTFFKEIPLSTFSNLFEFGMKVEAVRNDILERYYNK